MASDDRRTIEHLLGCPTCQERLGALLRPRRNVVAEKIAKILHWSCKPDYSAALRKGERMFQAERLAYDRERMQAVGLDAEIRGQSPERRQVILANSPRFHTWGLLELLLDRAREDSFREPVRGEETAALALRLADR
ncbi:MAG TPA: hypothetical protein VGR07_13505, partial [Thermoanaerobaculia bacterium]|nr:hypothetical protein [Thermoanaerobaculia bacterium]